MNVSGKGKARRGPTMAERADRHDLYEQAVLDSKAEVDFMRATYRSIRGRAASFFREDFAGSASTACEWVRRSANCHAIGVALDPAVLEWGRKHRVARLTKSQRSRVRLVEGNVLNAAPVFSRR